MDRTRIWHVLVIVFAVALSLWFATPPMRVVLERRVVTEIEEEGKWETGNKVKNGKENINQTKPISYSAQYLAFVTQPEPDCPEYGTYYQAG